MGKSARHILAVLITSALFQGAHASASSPNENQVKAAILFNLARFSEWPQEEDTQRNNFRICTNATAPMRAALDELSGKDIHERSLEIRHFQIGEKINTICDVFFVSGSKSADKFDFKTFHDSGTLTVGDSPHFTLLGGCMSIQRIAKSLKFTVNSVAMSEARIKPSSKILSLSVEPGE